MRLSTRISAFLIILSCFLVTNAQELDWEKMLIEDVENVNPVYMPVVGVGAGYINYMGDVRNNGSNPLLGNLALKANMHAFIDGQKHYKFNLYALFTIPNGTPITVIQHDYLHPEKNFRFQTDIMSFGVNCHYDFDHFIKKGSLFRPFVSLGVEFLTFGSKADLIGVIDKGGNDPTKSFYYWNDGTIRDRLQSNERPSHLVKPDGIYETDIRGEFKGNYNQYTVSVPFDIGVEFAVTNRTSIRLGYSYHFNFTDDIDNVSSKFSLTSTKYNIDIKDNGSAFDNFGYTYASLHFDLFSDPKMLRLNRMFLELENFDYDLIGDEDGDMVFDINDRCLHTPNGVAVDTSGCPFDTDLDGVPDHLDKQAYTPMGAIVDRDGVEIPDDLVWANLNQEALPREEVEMYLSLMNNLSGSGRRLGSVEIPEKFKSVDADGDGYISFDEVLKSIDSFFDFDTELTTQDIYELNDFFFSQ